jgi:GTP-binding protein
MGRLRKTVPKQTPLFAISAQSGMGLKNLLFSIEEVVLKARRKAQRLSAKNEVPVHTLPDGTDTWTVERQDDIFIVRGDRIERLTARTDLKNTEAVQHLRDIMHRQGIMHELLRQGIAVGQQIKIADKGELTY